MSINCGLKTITNWRVGLLTDLCVDHQFFYIVRTKEGKLVFEHGRFFLDYLCVLLHALMHRIDRLHFLNQVFADVFKLIGMDCLRFLCKHGHEFFDLLVLSR